MWQKEARPEQVAPPGDWVKWLILAGRGWGKTRSIVEWADERARETVSLGVVTGQTAADIRDILVDGPSGFGRYGDIVYEPSKRRLTWPNGSKAALLSADEPARFRGPQCHWAICDELASWKDFGSFDMLMLGLRLGSKPQVAIATTPRPIPIIKALMKDSTCVVTRGTTYDNRANLSKVFYDQVIKKYEGTRLGRQELNAEIIEDAAGALWKRDTMIDAYRVSEAPKCERVIVAIDPSGSKRGDECGIVVCGLHGDNGYILADLSVQASPNEWAEVAVRAYHSFRADRIIAEKNFGGDMVATTIQTISGAPYPKLITASKSKQARAEPVAALYEQGKVHHVGHFAALEDELCSWEPGSGMASPDRLDAMVWGITELMVGAGGFGWGVA